MTENRLMNVKDVAAYLGIDPFSVYHWVSQGRLPCVRLSARCLRFRSEDIEQYVASMSNYTAADHVTSDRCSKGAVFSKSRGDER
jgi:excisionase family DNA binding protein